MEKLAWGEFYQCLKPELLYPAFLQGWNCCRSKVRALPSWLDEVLWELEEVIQIAARYCDRTHGHGDFDGFILLQKEDLTVILLNICTDKWQLHSITFQWEHYSHNIGNGKTFSCAFQPGDDVWKEPIGGVRHRHGESVKTGARQSPLRASNARRHRNQEDNRSGEALMLVSPIPQRGGRKNKPPEQLPSGLRGGLQVRAFWAAHSPSGDPALPAPLRRERAPITSYYGSGQWNDVPGN